MERGVSTMNEYIVILCDELGEDFRVVIEVPDLVENVTEYVREQYPESSIVYIMPKGF
jgi:hypothetical protein